MVGRQGKPETSDRKARRLQFCKESGLPLAAKDEAWLKAWEAADLKKQAKALRAGKAAEDKAAKKAKKEGRSVTIKDLHEAMQPATPATRGREIPESLTAARAALDLAMVEEKSIETMAHARALALAALPRNRTKARQVSHVCRIGREEWLRVTYTAMEPGVDLAYGADLLAFLAIVDRVHRTGQTRLEFESLRDLVQSLESSYGGKTAELTLHRLKRAEGTGIAVSFYRNEADARDAANAYRSVKFTIVRDWWAPRESRQHEALLSPYVEVSADFAEHIRDPKAMLWVPVEVVRALSNRPLALQLFMLIYPRSQSTRDWWEMPFEEFMDLLNETNRPERNLMADIQGALSEIHEVTGGRLKVGLVDAPPQKGKGRGRPAKRWALRFGPSESLTRKPKGTLKG